MSINDLYGIYVAVFVLLAALLVLLRRHTIGMLWGALRTSELATAMLGYHPVRTRVFLFSFGAFVGAIGGGLYAIQLSNASVSSFEALTGVTWLAVIVIFGARSITGALVAGVSFTVMGQLATAYLGITVTEALPVLWGLGAVMVVKDPRGAIAMQADQARWVVSKLVSLRRQPPVPPSMPGTVAVPAMEPPSVKGASRS